MSSNDESLQPEDEQRPPRLFPSRGGMRMVSMAALVERIVFAFSQEHADNSQSLIDAKTKADYLKLIRDTAQYVISVESIMLTSEEQAEVIRQCYGELFAYGPLDALFDDEEITTIAIEGIEKVSVRRGHGELESLDLLFEDHEQFNRIVRRLLRNAGAELREDQPYIEAGLVVDGRRVCVNCVAPPITYQIRLDIRVHPREIPSLDSIASSPKEKQLLEAIAKSPHGFIVAGEPESGKTILMGMMLRASDENDIITVERAGELMLSEGTTRFIAQWPVGDQPVLTFGDQIANAMETEPKTLVIDEIRSDEPESIFPLLSGNNPPRLMWVFRGSTDGKRLIASLGMIARRSHPAQSESLVRTLHDRLPFIVTVRRRNGRLQLYSIAEWQFPDRDAEYADYIELMEMGWHGLELSGRKPMRELGLPEDFWE